MSFHWLQTHRKRAGSCKDLRQVGSIVAKDVCEFSTWFVCGRVGERAEGERGDKDGGEERREAWSPWPAIIRQFPFSISPPQKISVWVAPKDPHSFPLLTPIVEWSNSPLPVSVKKAENNTHLDIIYDHQRLPLMKRDRLKIKCRKRSLTERNIRMGNVGVLGHFSCTINCIAIYVRRSDNWG